MPTWRSLTSMLSDDKHVHSIFTQSNNPDISPGVPTPNLLL